MVETAIIERETLENKAQEAIRIARGGSRVKIVINIYRTNPDGSNSLYTMSHPGELGMGSVDIMHYGWKHEFPDITKLREALKLIIESIKQT